MTSVLAPAAATLVAAVAVAVVVIPKLDEGRLAPDCRTFRFDARAWRSAEDAAARLEMADGVAVCDVLVGKRRREVARLLGRPLPPLQSGYPRGVYWRYDGLGVYFERDHVAYATADPS